MALPLPKGSMGINAGWTYRSGGAHYAWDLDADTGDPVYAPVAGIIRAFNDGVVDRTPNQPGNRPGEPGRGSESNWVLLEFLYNGRWATAYFQHLKSVDDRLVVGQWVREGQLLGYSGETGQATGPHLHLAVFFGRFYSKATRYLYLTKRGSISIYPPSKMWTQKRKPTVPAGAKVCGETKRVAPRKPAPKHTKVPAFPGTLRLGSRGPAVVALQRKLGVRTTGYFGTVTRSKVVAYQKKRPWLWPADGLVGPKTYRSITGGK